ncbi:MAG: hypothetical protein NTY01_02290 [Verrucomicrobia bacterium]|nr:hypothetical protein [Verrucomicrobiota bacterium]
MPDDNAAQTSAVPSGGKNQNSFKPQFKKLTWVGFTSNTTKSTMFHRDNFNLTTSQK